MKYRTKELEEQNEVYSYLTYFTLLEQVKESNSISNETMREAFENIKPWLMKWLPGDLLVHVEDGTLMQSNSYEPSIELVRRINEWINKFEEKTREISKNYAEYSSSINHLLPKNLLDLLENTPYDARIVSYNQPDKSNLIIHFNETAICYKNEFSLSFKGVKVFEFDEEVTNFNWNVTEAYLTEEANFELRALLWKSGRRTTQNEICIIAEDVLIETEK
ncbi:DUF4085 family protein [Bacillus tianshenii]|nr:DUF4085 family protein [Bacillus tianshenii]